MNLDILSLLGKHTNPLILFFAKTDFIAFEAPSFPRFVSPFNPAFIAIFPRVDFI